MCLVNDRLHVALAVGADGGHVGADDLPVAAARRVLGPAARARRHLPRRRRRPGGRRGRRRPTSASGPAYATTTKDGLPDPIGPGRRRGGRRGGAGHAGDRDRRGHRRRAPALRGAGAHGVAVVGAVAGAADPARPPTGCELVAGTALGDDARDVDVAVVGGGIIGLAIAWRCARRGAAR